jgi:hypothetical protein
MEGSIYSQHNQPRNITIRYGFVEEGQAYHHAFLTLTLHKICSFYFLFFMLPSEAHQGSAADLVEPHDLHSS